MSNPEGALLLAICDRSTNPDPVPIEYHNLNSNPNEKKLYNGYTFCVGDILRPTGS